MRGREGMSEGGREGEGFINCRKAQDQARLSSACLHHPDRSTGNSHVTTSSLVTSPGGRLTFFLPFYPQD
ncbi:hypothetical protein J6590_003627 [Homalodisca vitripennis]|nr:hypothetical protein J6590_003627 [Homalodisca vitripennis]